MITTHNLHEHTGQEVFDHMCSGVLAQEGPSRILSRCVYHDIERNRKCPLGHLIRPEDLHLVQEVYHGHSFDLGQIHLFRPNHFDAIGWKKLKIGAVERRVHYFIVGRVQSLHDTLAMQGDKAFIYDFRRGVRRLAGSLRMKAEFLDNMPATV